MQQLQYARDFLETVTSGILPDATRTRTQQIDGSAIQSAWNATLGANTFPRAGKGARDTRTPEGYFMDQFGSRTNREPLLLTHRPLNQMKGRVFNERSSPQSLGDFTTNLNNAIDNGTGEDALLEPIRMVCYTCIYIYIYIRALSVVLQNTSDKL